MNLKQQTFITEYLRFGDAQTAYRNAYKNYHSSWRTIESSGNRLLNKPEIAEAIKNAKERIRWEVEEEFKNQVRKELLSVQRKREILAMIAQGEVYIEQTQKGKDCRMCKLLVKPGFGQMLKAIDMDNKMTGHYVTKRQTTVVHTTATKQPPENQQEQPEPVAKESENEKTQQIATTERSELIETNKKDNINEVTVKSEPAETNKKDIIDIPEQPCNCENVISQEQMRRSLSANEVLIE